MSAVFEAVRTVAPSWHVPPAAVASRSLSRKIAESRAWSPWSKIERYRLWAPAVMGVDALSTGVAPS
jgi:hypothetical protein